MADDRLDDAIDAVVRAVDRIERATRGQLAVGAQAAPAGVPAAESPAAPAPASQAVSAADVQPPPVDVSPGPEAWGAPRKKRKPKRKRLPELPDALTIGAATPAGSPAFASPSAAQDAGREQLSAALVAAAAAAVPGLDGRSATAVPTAAAPFRLPAPAASPAAAAPWGAAAPPEEAEVHELVGRIVARTQELDEQLEAARAMRAEISELVARLAAAAKQR